MASPPPSCHGSSPYEAPPASGAAAIDAGAKAFKANWLVERSTSTRYHCISRFDSTRPRSACTTTRAVLSAAYSARLTSPTLAPPPTACCASSPRPSPTTCSPTPASAVSALPSFSAEGPRASHTAPTCREVGPPAATPGASPANALCGPLFPSSFSFPIVHTLITALFLLVDASLKLMIT